MFDAIDKYGRNRQVGEATRADGPYTCPACRQRVHLRRGLVRVPYFAHNPGVAPDQCPRLVSFESAGLSISSPHLGSQIDWLETEPPVASLFFTLQEDSWHLGVSLPPLPREEADSDVLDKLERSWILVTGQPDERLAKAPGVDLWPGSDPLILEVQPGPERYRIRVDGPLDARVRRLLEHDIRVFIDDKAIFCGRAGRWRQLEFGSATARWGDFLFFLYKRPIPPAALRQLNARQYSSRAGVTAYGLQLPCDADAKVERLVEELGCRIAGQDWRLAPRYPVPLEIIDGLQVIPARMSVGVWTEPHSPGVRYHIQGTDERVQAGDTRGPFLMVFSAPNSEIALRSADKTLRYQGIVRPSAEKLAEILNQQPRLELHAGEQVVRGISEVGSSPIPGFEISLDDMPNPERITIESPVPVTLRVIGSATAEIGRLSADHMDAYEATRQLRRCLSALTESAVIEIDAGAHGILHLSICTPAEQTVDSELGTVGSSNALAIQALPFSQRLQQAIQTGSRSLMHAVLGELPSTHLIQKLKETEHFLPRRRNQP